MSEILRMLTNASPFVVAIFAVMWLVNRILQFIGEFRGDPKFDNLNKGIERLASIMSTQGENAAKAYKDESKKITEALKDLEAATISHSLVHERCAFVNQQQGATQKEVLSLRIQRTMIQYQWNWCRDTFYSIITQSIQNNGIIGNEEGVSLRVTTALLRAADDSRKSIEQLGGIDSYHYAALFDHDVPRIMHELWHRSVPIYHRNITGSLKEAIEDLGLWIKQIFKDSFDGRILTQEDPDTGRIYTRISSEDRIESRGLYEELSDALKTYNLSESETSDLKPTTALMRKHS